MNVQTLEANSLGPIEHAHIRFGDLTVFVGPQATGKGILLQFLKLIVDSGPILAEFKRQGLDWQKKLEPFLEIYLGEGMSSVWTEAKSRLKLNDEVVDFRKLVNRRRGAAEKLFFIPAQRVLTLGKGWPRTFSDYSPGDPFVVRDFSEKIRRFMESRTEQSESLFPQTRRLKAEFRHLVQENIFTTFGLSVDRHGAQKRLVLRASEASEPLPYMVWSAGQREFVPLLLGLYWLMPPASSPQRDNFQWVVIEEPEMGLHPRAISTVLLLVLELLWRHYRVCISTHSPHVLDLVWALRVCQEHHASPQKLLDLFEIKHPMKDWADFVMTKEARVYYFDPNTHRTRDISELDPGAEDRAVSGWGGLAEFSGRAADVVAEVIGDSRE